MKVPVLCWLVAVSFSFACSRVATIEQRADTSAPQSAAVPQTATAPQTTTAPIESASAATSTSSADNVRAYRTSTEPRALWVGHHVGHWGPQDHCKLTDEGALTCDGKKAIGAWGKPAEYLAKDVRVPPKAAKQLLDEVEASAVSDACVLRLKERDARNQERMASLSDGGVGPHPRDTTGSGGSICKGGYGPNTVCSGAGCGKLSVCVEACDSPYDKVLALRKQFGQRSASP
jgi:hypothetical protein